MKLNQGFRYNNNLLSQSLNRQPQKSFSRHFSGEVAPTWDLNYEVSKMLNRKAVLPCICLQVLLVFHSCLSKETTYLPNVQLAGTVESYGALHVLAAVLVQHIAVIRKWSGITLSGESVYRTVWFRFPAGAKFLSSPQRPPSFLSSGGSFPEDKEAKAWRWLLSPM
jgi:hypothetical protein